jgi:hypothetical protein
LRHRLEKAFSGYVDGVLDSLCVPTSHFAGSDRHNADRSSFAICSPTLGKLAIRSGAFLAIAVATAKMLKAEDEIAKRFDVRRISIDQLLIREMRAAAEKAGAKWPAVLRADGAERDSRDWRTLILLVKRAMPAVKAAIEEVGREHTVLITRAGLLARYGQLDFFDWLRERVGARGGIRGAWALIACDNVTALPVLDGHPVPVFTAAQWARIPDDWIRNLHRSDAPAMPEPGDGARRQG